MKEYKYARIPITKVPAEIVNQYNQHSIEHDGHVVIEIQCGMYDIPQAGILANIQLKQHLKKYGYYETKTHGLFRHKTRNTTFTLFVDNFGAYTTSKSNLDHIHNAINSKYNININTISSTYLGMSLKWNYRNRHIDISMPG